MAPLPGLVTQKRFLFSDKLIDRLRPPAKGQVQYSDAGMSGLSLVVGHGGSKTFRSQYRFGKHWQSRKLGKHHDFVDGEDGTSPERVTVDWARNEVRLDKLDAAKGRDPADRNKRLLAADMSFSDVVKEYLAVVEDQQRTYSDTKRILQTYCASLNWKPLASITKDDVQSVLNGFRQQGKTRTAQAILVKLKTLWKWAHKQDYVDTFVVDKCEAPHRGKVRDKVYNTAELKALWDAAGKLDAMERDYVRLLMLLVPRRKALAHMKREHLNEDMTMWTVPFELVKAKATSRPRTYRVPLPPLARSILEKRLADDDNEYVFGVDTGVPYWPGAKLIRRLKKEGAPKSFTPHSLRHTCATWFEDQGYGLFERGLVLNHAAQGVTAGYSHGFAKDLKLNLLTMWEGRIREAVGAKKRAIKVTPDTMDALLKRLVTEHEATESA